MREIKFRGFALAEMVQSQWLTGFGVMPIEMSDDYAKRTGIKKEVYLYTESGTYQVQENSVGQFTGLKDKNDDDIYFDDALTNGEMTRKVIWREDDSQIQLSVNDANHDNRIKLTQQLIDTFGLTICGNIYENPELLNG